MAADYVEYPQESVHVALSMTFPDPAHPESIVDGIRLPDVEHPGLLQWMGGVNLHREALRGNGQEPASVEAIRRWTALMDVLRGRGIPIAIHADLGADGSPTRNLHLMREVLRL